MGLDEELRRIGEAAAAVARPGERVAGVLAAEPSPDERVYLCAFEGENGRSWLAFDEAGDPVESRLLVRDAASIAALCELAGETAGGGDLSELRARLLTLRLTENPHGIEEAEEAALALERAVGAPPRVASPAYLDEVGLATHRLEHALGTDGRSPFADAMQQGASAVQALTAEVEAGYRRPLR